MKTKTIMNFGQMVVALGYKSKPRRRGFPCPNIILNGEPPTTPVGAGAETRTELEDAIDSRKTVGQRAGKGTKISTRKSP